MTKVSTTRGVFRKEVRREAEIAFTTSLVCAAPNEWLPILVVKTTHNARRSSLMGKARTTEVKC